MPRWRIVVSRLGGSVVLTLPTPAPVRCDGSDTASRGRLPISERLLRRSWGWPTRSSPTTPRR